MKRILMTTLAGIGLFFVVLIGLVVFAASFGKKEEVAQLPDKIVLTLDLDQGIKEKPPQQSVIGLLQQGEDALTLQQMVQTLDQARLDQRVQGLVVDVRDGDFGLASVQELRDAVQRFRRSGKFAYFYADTLGQRPAMAEYWLATSFDQIWLQPLGELAITGFGAELPFGRAALDKFGIEPEMLHVGKYKSFPEMAMRNEPSPENAEMTKDMLDVLTAQFTSDITLTRHVATEDVAALMQQAPLSSKEALVDGLIDAVGYRDEFDSYLEQVTKGGEPVEMSFYHVNGPRPVPGEKIALINVVGALANTSDQMPLPEDVADAEETVQAIQDAADQKTIKAIIVRVDSPGGTPLAADMIRRAIQLAKQRKPVVVSMSNAAASGGYWMSVAANKIVAQPATMTGSIGVFGGKFNAAGLWKKLGIRWVSIPDNGQQDMWSINRPFTAASREKIQKKMQDTYDIFVRHVAQGRSMKLSQVEALAQGRVWTGSQALEKGLVDNLGGVDVAANVARELAHIPIDRNINLEPFPKQVSLMDQIRAAFSHGMPLKMLGTWMKQAFIQSVQSMLASSAVAIKVSA